MPTFPAAARSAWPTTRPPTGATRTGSRSTGCAAANGSGSYSWNTTGLAAGTYYIAGYLYTPSGTAVFSHLTTSFTVVAAAPSFTLSSPASGSYVSGQTISVQWTDANVPSGSTISLAYDTTTNWGNPKWIEINGVSAANGSGSYSWNTTGLAAGTYYIAGYLYTPSGTAVFSHLTTSFTVTAFRQPMQCWRLWSAAEAGSSSHNPPPGLAGELFGAGRTAAELRVPAFSTEFPEKFRLKPGLPADNRNSESLH